MNPASKALKEIEEENREPGLEEETKEVLSEDAMRSN